MSGARSLVVVQTAIPAYRQNFVDEVFDQYDGPVKFLTGHEQFQRLVITELRDDDRVGDLKNRYLLGRRLLWQSGALVPALGADRCVVEINARVLSSWMILLARKLLRRPTVVHGHAWSRQGAGKLQQRLRMWMCGLANEVVVYTETERDEMKARSGSTHVWAAPNASLRSAQMQPLAATDQAADFVISGRLVAAKKPQLALAAFAAARERMPSSSKLLFVGVGPERSSLEAEVEHQGLGDQVEFLGAVFELEQLRDVYAGCVAALSPGYVGLSLTQCNGFGLPMIYARDEPHAPEIEAAEEGVNSVSVPSDDAGALADAMVALLEHNTAWLARREEISRRCRERYSVEAMATGFIAAVEAAG